MIEIDNVQASIREHLLGRVKGEEREPFEERFLTDPEFREVVLLIESELFDDYSAGLLSEVDLQSFIRQYVNSPSRKKDVQFTSALLDHLGEEAQPALTEPGCPRPKPNIFNIFARKRWIPVLASGALAVTAILIFSSAIGIWLSPPPDYSAQVELLNKQPRGNEPSFPIELQQIQNRANGEGQKISIPTGTSIVELQCHLPEGYRSYQATLRVVNNADVFSVEQLQPQDVGDGKTLYLRIPAHILIPQDYIFSVKGLTEEGNVHDIADYFFRIVK